MISVDNKSVILLMDNDNDAFQNTTKVKFNILYNIHFYKISFENEKANRKIRIQTDLIFLPSLLLSPTKLTLDFAK